MMNQFELQTTWKMSA